MNVPSPRPPARPGSLPVASLLLGLLLLAGCRPAAGPDAPARLAPRPDAPARFPAVPTAPAAPASAPASSAAWAAAPFAVVQTELSPATLVRSTGRYLGLFCDLPALGLGAPAHVAWSTRDGPRVFASGQTHDASGMEENWLLVWFAGAAGWTNWDAPWAVFLQHKARWLRLDERGLHLEFPQAAGEVVLMPLYGHDRLGTPTRPAPARPGRKAPPLKTWEWAKAIPREPLTRLRYWAGATRQFPMDCEERVAVDRGRDRLRWQTRLTWHAIADDWRTRPVKLAPISPVLALAARDEAFPAQFARPAFDMELPTPWGPLRGVPDADVVEWDLPVLQYLHETGADLPGTPPAADPWQAAALAALPRAVSAPSVEAGEAGRALAFLDAPARANLLARLRAVADTRSPAALEAAWALALQAGDIDGARQRWPQLRALALPAEPSATWIGFGPETGPELAVAARRALLAARLAWVAGDAAGYHEGAVRFGRALVHLWALQRGADWFRAHPPGSLEPWGEAVFLTGLRAGSGASVAGPAHPPAVPDRAWEARWRGATDPDVARFCREYLPADVRRELDWLQARAGAVPPWQEAADGRPAFLQLRALLVPGPAAAVVGAGQPEAMAADPRVSLGACVALLRQGMAQGPLQRLIPGGEPGPFLPAGVPGPGPSGVGLGTTLRWEPSQWPDLASPGWRTPAGGAWPFGRIKGTRDGRPENLQRVRVNAVTEAVLGSLP